MTVLGLSTLQLKRVALCAITILLVVAVFSPALIAVLWHLRHGDVISYEGKLIPIPRNWYPRVEFQKLEITKPPLTVFSYGSAPPVFSWLGPLGNRTHSVEETYESFETYYRAYGVGSNEIVSESLRLGSGDSEAICMKKSLMKNDERASVSCLLFAGTWNAEFIGQPREVENFMQMIRGTRPK